MTLGHTKNTIISMRTGRPRTGRNPVISIRINPDIYHRAKITAVTRKMTISHWLEEAINEKVDREKPGLKDE